MNRNYPGPCDNQIVQSSQFSTIAVSVTSSGTSSTTSGSPPIINTFSGSLSGSKTWDYADYATFNASNLDRFTYYASGCCNPKEITVGGSSTDYGDGTGTGTYTLTGSPPVNVTYGVTVNVFFEYRRNSTSGLEEFRIGVSFGTNQFTSSCILDDAIIAAGGAVFSAWDTLDHLSGSHAINYTSDLCGATTGGHTSSFTADFTISIS